MFKEEFSPKENQTLDAVSDQFTEKLDFLPVQEKVSPEKIQATEAERLPLVETQLNESYAALEKKSIHGREKKSFVLETGETVEVSSREFEPTEKRLDSANVIFLSGWAMSAESSSIEKLGQAFAEQSGNTAYALSSHTEGILDPQEGLYREAKALSQFIKEKNLTRLVIAGHSQGGSKSIDLVSILQKDPSLQIDGLILIDSMGLYDQKPLSLATGFTKDAILNTPQTLGKKSFKNPEVLKQGIRAVANVTQGIFSKIVRNKLDTPTNVIREVRTMAETNPRIQEVSVPTIIISGTEDIISHPDKIVPPAEEARIISQWEQETDNETGYRDSREEYLKQNQLPQSPYVRMLTPEKLGHHGLPLFRSESVAKASLYLLKRYQRKTKS